MLSRLPVFLIIIGFGSVQAMERVKTADQAIDQSGEYSFGKQEPQRPTLPIKKMAASVPTEKDPLTKRTFLEKAIINRDKAQFKTALNFWFQSFKRYIADLVRKNVSEAEIITSQIEMQASLKDLVEYLVYACKAHSPESVSHIIELDSLHNADKNELSKRILENRDLAEILAGTLYSKTGELHMFFSACKDLAHQHAAWSVIYYAHTFGLPLLMVAYVVYLLYPPIINSDINSLLQELKYEAIPLYVGIFVYCSLYGIKYGINGNCCGRFNHNGCVIDQILSDVVKSLEKLHKELENAVSKPTTLAYTFPVKKFLVDSNNETPRSNAQSPRVDDAPVPPGELHSSSGDELIK